MRHAIFAHYAYAVVSAEFNYRLTVQVTQKLERSIESPTKCTISSKTNNRSIVT